MRTARNLINTSADDCRITLSHMTAQDLPVMREALTISEQLGHKSRSVHLKRRIKRLEQEGVE